MDGKSICWNFGDSFQCFLKDWIKRLQEKEGSHTFLWHFPKFFPSPQSKYTFISLVCMNFTCCQSKREKSFSYHKLGTKHLQVKGIQVFSNEEPHKFVDLKCFRSDWINTGICPCFSYHVELRADLNAVFLTLDFDLFFKNIYLAITFQQWVIELIMTRQGYVHILFKHNAIDLKHFPNLQLIWNISQIFLMAGDKLRSNLVSQKTR